MPYVFTAPDNVYPWHFSDDERCVKENWFAVESESLALQFLCIFSVNFDRISTLILHNYCVHLSVFCILINLFHIIVLFEQSMRTASIYIILLAIALMDIISMFHDINIEILKFYRVINVCFSKKADYNILVIKDALESIRNYTRRCSTWLSFSIALIRTLVIKYPMNPKFDILSKSKTAFIVIPFILILCAPLHIMDIYKYQIILLDENYKCTQFPVYTSYYYHKTTSLLFLQDDALLFSIYRTIDAIISKVNSFSNILIFLSNFQIIPCILFPTITFLLILEIRKQRIKRNKLKSSFAPKESKNTTKFVLFLTLPFFLAELPLGIIFMIRPTFLEGTWSSIFMEAFENLFLLILSGTTALHMVVCIFMSSQYREVAWSTIRFGYVLEILSKPKIAFYIIPTILILCAPIHLMDIYKYEIEIYDEHYKCTQYPEYTTYFYGNTVSAMFQKDDNRIQKINRMIDAIISKFIPCILFPIVTIILVIEIRKADIQKQRMAKSSNESKKASIESRNTSRLVLFLTLPFFMAELPLGIIFMISPMDIFRKAIGFTLFMEGLEKFFSFILSGTTATHMIVCLFMSAQYRKIVWSFVRCGYTVG
ncbi:hypothetical protein CRE_15693 [Caenorhabditis remanei]|uniref:G-protein coupled receptors family 1 profile domain-containing protein n=1 Tax=Caenorhabditis remanei TaxID=31234 RepID=E3N884_CAERE|nr:hypothetical protein CRE_15693 [Caenorhabditis remanei]